MRQTRRWVPGYLFCLRALLSSAIFVCSPALGAPSGAAVQVAKDFGRLPLYFIENQGQVDSRVMFYQRGSGVTIFFTQEGVGFSLRRREAQAGIAGSPARPGSDKFLAKKHHAPASNQPPPALVQLTPVGMRPQVEITPADPQTAKFNYFIGNDPGKWRTDVPSYGAVLYREAYPGIDLKFYGAARQLEYDIIVKPGADPDLVQFRYAGITSLTVTPTGDLAIKLPDGGELLQKKPVVYQEIAGVRIAREGKFRVGPDTAGHAYSFEVAAYDKTTPLIIDPVLVYSTYLGGSGDDNGNAIAVDQSGCVYVAGSTSSAGLSTLYAYQPSINGQTTDAFVAKFNATGSTLVFYSYLGGSSMDLGYGLALGNNGDVYVTGLTYSADFPRYHYLPATGNQNQKLGLHTVFVTQLAASGNSLVYSTFLGGSSFDQGKAIVVDNSGNVFITGDTASGDFPVTQGSYQTQMGGKSDAFLTKLGPDKMHLISITPLVIAFYPDIVFSTFFGGNEDDVAFAAALARDGTDNVYIAGETFSSNFPTEKAYRTSFGGGVADAFVASFSSTGALFFSTYLGGDGQDAAFGVTVDPHGGIYVTGGTLSGPSSFPLQNAFQGSLDGGMDAFVTKFNPPSQPFPGFPHIWLPISLSYSTYLGGSGNDEAGTGIAVDSGGCAYVVGSTKSTDFPTINPCQPHNQGDSDVFVTKLVPDGRSLVCSTYLGGIGTDRGNGIALDTLGKAYVTGQAGDGFPTRNPFQANYGGNSDAFVAKLTDTSLPPLMLLLTD